MHSDVLFVIYSSVPAHLEMRRLINMDGRHLIFLSNLKQHKLITNIINDCTQIIKIFILYTFLDIVKFKIKKRWYKPPLDNFKFCPFI